MSDSRLEKFIYAICSMDVSDLPVPLSRIETLWNCLITGETPDFEPLSRNEKYLMAMLDRYDISNLPAPMSRGEKLLYKIAVGETDLSDVPGYLSRYEELLKYLIENGGISGGDFEYVLYTLNQSLYTLYTTAEKPVKSAILKGQTLVNICKPFEFDIQTTGSGLRHLKDNLDMFNITVDDNKKYSVWVEIDINEIGAFSLSHTGATSTLVFNNNDRLTLTHGSTIIYPCVKRSNSSNNNFSIGALEGSTEGRLKGRIMVFEGDIRGFELSYFTGMQSVKMPVLTTTGKNLFNYQGKELSCYYNASLGGKYAANSKVDSYCVEVLPNTTYTLSCENKASMSHLTLWDKNKIFIDGEKAVNDTFNRTFTTPSNCKYIRFPLHKEGVTNVQLEEGSTSASYEPFKSNILTVNEEVELRGIGDVRDELNLLTGEVTQRIGEIVLDGSDDENWVKRNNGDGTNTITFQIPLDANRYDEIILDKFALSQLSSDGIEGFGYAADVKMLFIEIKRDRLNNVNVDEFKQWLSQNPITVQYELTTESIKTVDLTVVDQDNQPTQLGTFENVTHVSLEAENLIPEVEMEVAINLLEDTVFTLTDAFNTLYPTAAKPVKSAILMGNTLVNIVNNDNWVQGTDTDRYLTGMQSVKMPVLTTCGKNLCPPMTIGGIYDTSGKEFAKETLLRSDFIKLDTKITISSNNFFNRIFGYDENKNFIELLYSDATGVAKKTIDVESRIKYIRVRAQYSEDFTIQIEQGSVATPYEPYKSNILSCNEEVTLRGIGDVQDTLDLMTGEVTQRIGEIVLDGSESWNISGMTRPNHLRLYLLEPSFKQDQNVINNRFADNGDIKGRDVEGVYMSNTIDIQVEHSRLSEVSVDGFKNWLRENNIKVQAILSQESVKTVDLTTVDQDNQPTQLGTFDDTTHVLLESEGLVPTASLTVRTKIPSASSTSLLMDDISTKQEQLEVTIDEQSENVDATMIATTEIFEETL